LKHQTEEPKSFLQGEEFRVLRSYVSTYLGALRQYSVIHSLGNTKYLAGGTGPTIILLHAIGSKKSHFRSTMKELIKCGYSVISPDVPGIYPSVKLTSGKHNLRNLSGWLKSFTDELNIKNYVLLGNSLSASLAAYHAERYPEDVLALILLSMPATFNEEGEDLKTIAMTLLVGMEKLDDLEELLSECFYVAPNLPAVVKKLIMSDIISNQTFIKELLEDIKASQVQLSNRVKLISSPTLLISGDSDKICPPEFNHWIHTQIKNSKLHILNKSKHLTFIERQRLVIKLIDDFLINSRQYTRLQQSDANSRNRQ
jgi:pimeloyl-ACP methyl ester carboxylesterase